MTLMSIAGIALTSDHTHLVYQRDILKAATDAATIATTRHMWTLSRELADEEVEAALRPIARRYILANIPESRRERAAETLEFTLIPKRDVGTVDILAAADLGGVIFGSWMYGNPVETTQVGSETERVEAGSITEVALAIDVTGSMARDLAGRSVSEGHPNSRIEIVKRAALELVDILTTGDSDSVAIGIVPWDYRIRVPDPTRWADNAWAQYPLQQQRYYPRPHKTSAQGEWQTLPLRPEPWRGCVDQRALSGDNPPGFSAAPPTQTPFIMGFYTSMLDRGVSRVAFQCYDDGYGERRQDVCYDDLWHTRYEASQFDCPSDTAVIPPIVPLTTDSDAVRSKIQDLRAGGGSTNSTLGIAWGHRLLAPDWRTIWGDAVHPIDPDQLDPDQYPGGSQKVLVLLTDGEDNNPDSTGAAERRDHACTAAKNNGIKVFTIAAMRPSQTLESELEQCSSKADDPSGQYVFINNTTPEELQAAFREIARQLVRFRRVS